MPRKSTKYILVTGGVVSSIGKGLASAAVGALLEARGLKITHLKLDPYINVDPGTMSPYQHGEVFVTDDGAETDLDLGHYERFTSAVLTRANNITSGRVYQAVIQKERRGEYLGATVQVIPHVTDEVKARIHAATAGADVAILEVGGTVGDIESLPFLEALRQLKIELGPSNAISMHVTLVPYIETAGELKTKPTQHSVKEMRGIGIQPDVLLCRSKEALTASTKAKISLFSNVPVEAVISAVDVGCIYELPQKLHDEGLDALLCERLNIWSRQPDLSAWSRVVERFKRPSDPVVRIGVVGKYVNLKDAYKSLHEALVHGSLSVGRRVELEYIDSEEVERQGADSLLSHLDGVLVPGGFGDRGTEGKISSIQYARTNAIPFFGICLGMQMAVVEYGRNVAGLAGAHSSEFVQGLRHPVVDLMDGQKDVDGKGGTMRLGAFPCALKPGTRAFEAYGMADISERHRHRYEVNNAYRPQLEQAGLTFSGVSPDGALVEMVELAGHPYFVACQFHPEFKSKPLAPHPLFVHFVKAATERSDLRKRLASEAKKSSTAVSV